MLCVTFSFPIRDSKLQVLLVSSVQGEYNNGCEFMTRVAHVDVALVLFSADYSSYIPWMFDLGLCTVIRVEEVMVQYLNWNI